jgi:hypothetical protein
MTCQIEPHNIIPIDPNVKYTLIGMVDVGEYGSPQTPYDLQSGQEEFINEQDFSNSAQLWPFFSIENIFTGDGVDSVSLGGTTPEIPMPATDCIWKGVRGWIPWEYGYDIFQTNYVEQEATMSLIFDVNDPIWEARRVFVSPQFKDYLQGLGYEKFFLFKRNWPSDSKPWDLETFEWSSADYPEDERMAVLYELIHLGI